MYTTRPPAPTFAISKPLLQAWPLVSHMVNVDQLIANWADLPIWQRDNFYIHSGYRLETNSYRRCLKSLFYVHNETVNIWTHLLGALAFFVLATQSWSLILPPYSSVGLGDELGFVAFFTGAILCLAASATYHTIVCHSHAVGRFGNQLDYIGIVLLIAGSFVPSIYYGFYCHPHFRKTYWTMITTLSLATVVVTWLPRFASPEWRPFRAVMFIALGLSAVLPVIHAIYIYSYEQLVQQMSLHYLILQGAFYIVGAVIYAVRIPERLCPGVFDLWGSSHQIFHVFVLLGAATHLKGLIDAYHYWHSNLSAGFDVCRSTF